jgi:excisionase family DNA binding protein
MAVPTATIRAAGDRTKPAPVPGRGSASNKADAPSSPGTSEPEACPPAERLAYSVDEAARLTGLSRDLLYNQMRQGNLAYIKVGRRRLITRRHLEEFLYIGPVPVTYPAGARGELNSSVGTAPGPRKGRPQVV